MRYRSLSSRLCCWLLPRIHDRKFSNIFFSCRYSLIVDSLCFNFIVSACKPWMMLSFSHSWASSSLTATSASYRAWAFIAASAAWASFLLWTARSAAREASSAYISASSCLASMASRDCLALWAASWVAASSRSRPLRFWSRSSSCLLEPLVTSRSISTPLRSQAW